MTSFTFKATVAAPAEVVFDVLTDHRGYADISPVRKVTLERDGDPAPNGVGAIRRVSLVGPPIREEVVEYQRPTRFAYRMLSGAPLRDHVGTVELTPTGDKTDVAYHVDTTPTIPVVGNIAAQAIKVAVKQLLNAIKKESERRAAAG
jgi:uncharacterized protein YndB with AHSA1/START domain